ncbi:hypothetical protein [Pseudonocardia sp. ICBG162]|uniref:hypothetical protein n=1 Tax=Pseudonocardia sp. ICBG162 TaxID=2846761 RepID=UPI001CF6110F|nr:hypothetical protein [Pseudonocardia sp. ICBG162]
MTVLGAPVRRRSVPPSLFGMASQLLNALTNVATAYIASTALQPAAFGEFVLAFAVVTLLLATGRGLIGSTLLTQLPATAPDARPALLRSVAGATVLAGLGAAVVLVVLGAVALPAVLWFAPWMVVVLFQDAGRHVFIATGRLRDAFLADAVWALVQGVALAGLLAAVGSVPVPGLVAAWGLGALAGAVVVVVRAGLPARPGGPRPWARATRDLAGWFTALSMLGQLETYLVLTLTGALLGAADAGGLRAVQLLVLQPPMVLLGAMLALMVPGFARLPADDPARRGLWLRRFALVAPVSVGVLLVAALAGPLMDLLFAQYSAYTPLVLPVAVQSALLALLLPTMALLAGTRRGRTAFVLHVLRTATIVVGVLVGIAVAGAAGLAWSLAVSGAVVALVTTVVAARVTRTGAPR